VADPSKTRRELSWETEIPLERTVRDMLESARENYRQCVLTPFSVPGAMRV
jgi:nucleoside-diphosphate-sugar epimerase